MRARSRDAGVHRQNGLSCPNQVVHLVALWIFADMPSGERNRVVLAGMLDGAIFSVPTAVLRTQITWE